MKAAERFVREKLLSVPHSGRNYKGELQEFLQGRGLARAEYRIVNCSGEPHAPLFEAEVSAEGESARAVGTGKAAAEKAAAAKLLAKLQKKSGEYRH